MHSLFQQGTIVENFKLVGNTHSFSIMVQLWQQKYKNP